jgi:hypothetical protein
MNHMKLRNAWITYRVNVDFQQSAFFIGCCKYADAYMMSDAWTYQQFKDNISNGRVSIRITVLGIYADEADAVAMQAMTVEAEDVQVNKTSPRCDPPGKRGAQGTPVRNVSTGARYQTAHTAARSIGVSNAAMSMHLSGRLKHLKGQKFERIDE